jgi:hypothetical protein
MGFLRRRSEETLNEILMREAGLGEQASSQQAVPVVPEPASPVALREPAVAAPRGADAMVVVRVPELSGSSIEFVTLPSGDVIVEEEQGDADLAPLADAVEATLAPPYRAHAGRQHADYWGVAATRIDVRTFSCDDADELELVRLGGRPTVTVDGAPSGLRIPELERAGEELAEEDYTVSARRIDGDFWEIRASAL